MSLAKIFHYIIHPKGRKPELASGTVYFSNSEISINILNDWIIENSKNAITFDQKHLDEVIKRKYLENVEVLPKEYCCIFDKAGYKDLDWVIAHWQASREVRAAQRKTREKK